MNTITGQKFRQMLVAGANKLEENKQRVNDMNVFPVPDGDTGTNMSLTITSAVKEILTVTGSNTEDVAKALSSGALRGARGNSGVILSQIFRGLYKGMKGAGDVDSVVFAAAFQKGTETAYKAVMKPKEGTILTVAKAASDAAIENAPVVTDIVELMEIILNAAKEMLAKTPEMLPVLKEAGVVDSGGEGLVMIYTGMLDALKREDEEIDPVLALSENKPAAAPAKAEGVYCIEMSATVKNAEEAAKEMETFLNAYGQKAISLPDGDKIEIHVHTKDPNAILTQMMKWGKVTFAKVENMAEHHEHVLGLQEKAAAAKVKAPMKEVGFIAVSAGEGLAKIFTDLGVDYVISGGQTMNPSTDDVLNAAKEVNAKTIYVMPNNKNIILAAEQAASIMTESQLVVIPTKSIPQGISAMISYVPDLSVEENKENMTEAISMVVSGAVTYAVRDTHMGEFDIKEGNILALKDNDISRVGTDMMETTLDLLSDMITDETGVVTLYYGADVTEEQAQELQSKAAERFPEVEVEMQEGAQPIYYFLLSAE